MANRYDILANSLIDINLALIGWKRGTSYESVDELIEDIQKIIDEALPQKDKSKGDKK